MKKSLYKGYTAVTILTLIVSMTNVFPINYAFASTLWSDGFESNNFSNWTSSNGVWAVQNGGSNTGSKKVEAKGNTDSTPDFLEKDISTVGQQNVVLKYSYKIAAGLESDDHIKVEWSNDGITWNQLADYTNINTTNNYTDATYTIAGASNQSGFRFRFSAALNSNGDQVWIDDVSITSDNIPVVVDVCPNVSGTQESLPCADQICTDAGNIWNVDNQTCTEKVVDPVVCDTGYHLVDNTCVADEVTPPPVLETAHIVVTKIICNNESDLPNWGNGGPDINADTATNFLSTHSSCRAGTNWNFEWAPISFTNSGDNTLGFTGSGWSVFGPTNSNGVAEANVLTNSSIWIREVMQNDFIGYSSWLSNGSNTPTSQDEISAEIYCDQDVLNYDNFDLINPTVANKTYYCVAFNAPKIVTPPQDNPVDDSTSTPPTNNDNNDNSNQSNSTSGGHRHEVSISHGQVLGAYTEAGACGEYLKEYIKLGGKNNPEEVKKLQTFLNEYLGANIPVTGFYGSMTYDWVKKFQTKHDSDVLIPWANAGAPTDGPTGYVYKTTKRWINIIKCPELAASTPIPNLP